MTGNCLSGIVDEHQKEYKRIKRMCPLPGCESKGSFVRLADHIHYYHKIWDALERRKWLCKAKKNVSCS